MAIATYSDLVAEAAAWAKRTDLTARIPGFITLAESRIKALLDDRLQDSAQTLTTSSGVPYVSLPADYLGARSLSIPGSMGNLGALSAEQYEEGAAEGATGTPRGYSIIGDRLYLYPTPDAAYPLTVVYTAAFPALTAGTPTNALLTRWPNLYLWGALVEAMKFTQNMDMMGVYENDFQAAIAGANLLSWKSSGPMRVQSDAMVI